MARTASWIPTRRSRPRYCWRSSYLGRRCRVLCGRGFKGEVDAMEKTAFAALLERDVDDISRAATTLPRDERRRTFEVAAAMLNANQPTVRALKIMRFVQAALAQETNARFPVAQARPISSAVMDAAAGTSAADVHRAAVDVMSLLAIKSTGERSNLAVLARLLESPREPNGPQKKRKSEPVRPASTTPTTTATTRMKRTS
jgi:hypothetical protein